MTQHYAMLHRNLLYTGITRGKRLVVLVGQKKAIAIAVRNVSGRRRGQARRVASARYVPFARNKIEDGLRHGKAYLSQLKPYECDRRVRRIEPLGHQTDRS